MNKMDRKLESCSKPSAVRKNPCLVSTMEKLFEKRNQTGDIKFIVDGEEIRAHRCVLAALSPKYEAQFYGGLAEKDMINVEDVSPDAFKEFLQFFYTEDVTLTLDNIEGVLNLAKQSLVDELIYECTNFLITVIGMDKLLWCYRLSLAYDVKPLEVYCVKWIGVNIKSLFETADFLSYERDMLAHILDLNSLNCKETDVFEACIAWARAKCERDENDATDTANLRAAFGESLYKIRFCSMKVKEFATINRQYVGLLSAQESTDVFEAIALKANGVHSSIFGDDNCKIREAVQPSLKCLFAKGPRIPLNETANLCYVQFTTNRAIMLNGFSLCNKIDGEIGMVIRISDKEIVGLDYTKTTSENDTKIIFYQSMQIEANERSVIVVSSKALFQSCSGLYGFELEKQTTQNGVSFAIIRNTSPNLIERLFFDIVDKP